MTQFYAIWLQSKPHTMVNFHFWFWSSCLCWVPILSIGAEPPHAPLVKIFASQRNRKCVTWPSTRRKQPRTFLTTFESDYIIYRIITFIESIVCIYSLLSLSLSPSTSAPSIDWPPLVFSHYTVCSSSCVAQTCCASWVFCFLSIFQPSAMWKTALFV